MYYFKDLLANLFCQIIEVCLDSKDEVFSESILNPKLLTRFLEDYSELVFQVEKQKHYKLKSANCELIRKIINLISQCKNEKIKQKFLEYEIYTEFQSWFEDNFKIVQNPYPLNMDDDKSQDISEIINDDPFTILNNRKPPTQRSSRIHQVLPTFEPDNAEDMLNFEFEESEGEVQSDEIEDVDLDSSNESSEEQQEMVKPDEKLLISKIDQHAFLIMEIINLLVIIASCTVCIIWAFNKRKEILSLKSQLTEDNSPLNQSEKKTVFEEQEDLGYISIIFQETVISLLKKISRTFLFCVLFICLLIWIFLEENLSNFSQSIYFFIGAMSQIFIGLFIFKNLNLYDPRVVMLARVTRWHSLDHIVKINNYITLTNQSLNLIIFSSTYYLSTFFGIDIAQNEISERNFEKFHRKFMAYGLGSVFAFFVIKSISNMFYQGSFMVTEILSRQENEGIEEDHPKNPAKIINNISKSFFKIFENALEFNALTNMGLCIFQDFFVTRSVYLLDRGFLNSFAIYSFGMMGSLGAMITFKNSNKLKLSDSNQFNISDKKMRKNCLYSIFSAILISSLGALFIMWNTFPDSIAVYNPFEKKISLRNLNNIDSFIMFLTSSLIVITLILNSLKYTTQNSNTVKQMVESSKICFSLTLLSSDFYAYFATVFPTGIFFFVLYINYSKGNIYGVTMEYLGIITYFQIIQFYQNFKSICNFTKSLVEARNIQSEKTKENLDDIEKICKIFGKFSTGVSLFILVVLCFVILVDSFNIQIVREIIVIEPGYILGVISGSILFYCLIAMDIKTHQNFLRVLLQKVKTEILRNVNEEEYEPPVQELAENLISETFRNQIFVYYIPVLVSMGIFFSLFGKKLIVIVMFGCFLVVMLNCYKNLIKGELLMDLQNVYKQQKRENNKGVDPTYVGLLSNIVGNSYEFYSNDPLSKLLILFCSSMICSEYFISNGDFLNKLFDSILRLNVQRNT